LIAVELDAPWRCKLCLREFSVPEGRRIRAGFSRYLQVPVRLPVARIFADEVMGAFPAYETVVVVEPLAWRDEPPAENVSLMLERDFH
jgi:hypothetical protein